MKKLSLIVTISILLTLIPVIILAQSVSITEISPDSPSSLSFNQKVTINFSYSIGNQGAVRIFIRPVTSGKLTPSYSASGSPVYRGRGRGTASFTITSGNTKVDQIRVQVLSSTQNQLIFEFYVPVELAYGPAVFTLVKPQLIDRSAVKARSQQYELLTPSDTLSEGVKEVKRTVTTEGIIEIHYSDGTIKGIISWDHWYTIDPVSGDTSYSKLMLNQVQGTDEPAMPPGFGTTANTSVDQEWLGSLNAWIEYLGNELLFSIETQIQDPESFENYKHFENENSSSLYERVNLRYTFLKKLLQYGS